MRSYRDIEIEYNLIQELNGCKQFLDRIKNDSGQKYLWISNGYYSWVHSETEKVPHFQVNIEMVKVIVQERIKQLEAELLNLGIKDV